MKSKGKCGFCNDLFSGTTVTKHLQVCTKRKEAQTKEPMKEKIFLLRAGEGPFWVYFEVKASSSLKEIDSFLRELWLECCGHLSAFRIQEQTYAVEPDSEFWDKTMGVRIANVLAPGLSFSHEYDFGTTTELNLKCLAERTGQLKGIPVLAKNEFPSFPCHHCEKEESKKICSQCLWDKEWMFCSSCTKKHDCDEDMFLPVVNSPRMGACGYTG